jgi:CheY-like chemotaxis protein
VHVLVVDDSDANRRLAELKLRGAGYAVSLAEDGPAALAELQRGPVPDVVLMDVYMPGMDGIATTRSIRALPGRAGAVPVIALTADATAALAQDCLHAGMNAVVTKPIDSGELAGAIATLLGARVADLTRPDVALLPSEPATPPA